MARAARRFYRAVETVRSGDGGFQVLLDGRPVRSFGKNILNLPNEKMARALAAEFEAQGEFMQPATMPLWRFAGMTMDTIVPHPELACGEIVKYAASDLLCYRAASPRELAQRQGKAWDGILRRFADDAGVCFRVTDAIAHVEQDRASLDYVAGEVEKSHGFELAALLTVTSLTGSALLALALHYGWLGGGEAWEAAHIDENWQWEQWGEDEEAAARRRYRHAEFRAALLALE